MIQNEEIVCFREFNKEFFQYGNRLLRHNKFPTQYFVERNNKPYGALMYFGPLYDEYEPEKIKISDI